MHTGCIVWTGILLVVILIQILYILSLRKNISETAHKTNSVDCVFSAFKSIKGDSYVIWGTPQYSIECYDLLQDKIIKTVSAAHSNTIFSCRHYLDRKGKRDLCISSSYDRSVKVWNIRDNWENLITINTAHTGYYIYSVSVLCDEKAGQNYIITKLQHRQQLMVVPLHVLIV